MSNNPSLWRVKAGFHGRQSRSQSRTRASDLEKIENLSRKQSHGIGVRRIRTVPFSSAYDSDAHDLVKTRLSQSQAEVKEPTNQNARFILWFPLTTPTI